MKVCIIVLLILSHFKTSSTVFDNCVQYEKMIAYIESKKLKRNKQSVFNYVLTKTKDTLFSVRIVSICQTESGFKSKCAVKYNNLGGLKYGKRAVSLNQAKYGIYNKLEDFVDDLIEYELKYGKSSWYWYKNKIYTNYHRSIYQKIHNQNLIYYGKTRE